MMQTSGRPERLAERFVELRRGERRLETVLRALDRQRRDSRRNGFPVPGDLQAAIEAFERDLRTLREHLDAVTHPNR